MIEQFGTKLGEWLYTEGMLEKNQIDLIRYSVEIICSEITENIMIFGYGIFTNQFLFTLMYLIFFHTLRHYFQGYHAKTIGRCLILTLGAYFTAMFLYTHITYEWGVLFLIISLLLQVDYCIKQHQFIPMMISILLKIAVLMMGVSLNDFSCLQLLAVTELIVSVSALSERRTNEK